MIEIHDIQAAAENIKDFIHKTPLIYILTFLRPSSRTALKHLSASVFCVKGMSHDQIYQV